jgi:hypothetical protein
MRRVGGLSRSAVEQVDEADGQEMLVGCKGYLPPLILVVLPLILRRAVLQDYRLTNKIEMLTAMSRFLR